MSRTLTPEEERVRDAVRFMIEAKPDGLGLSKEKIASELGKTSNAVLYWSTGDRSPRPYLRLKLSELAEKEGAPKRIVRDLRPKEESVDEARVP